MTQTFKAKPRLRVQTPPRSETSTGNTGQITHIYVQADNGRIWLDRSSGTVGDNPTPFRFTGKERDPETGLYYFGARYLDPKTSRWLSGDPALGEYVPVAPNSEQARRHNSNLPGLGGVFNYINLHVYHYSANNPVRYVDPDGETIIDNTTEQYLIVRGENGEIHIINPGERYDTTDHGLNEIDGIFMPDGSTYKTLDGNENAIFTVLETKNDDGNSIYNVVPDAVGERINRRGDRRIRAWNMLPWTRNRETSGMYQKDDGSEVGGSWWNRIQRQLGVNWTELPDIETWNNTLSNFRERNPNGSR